MNKLKTAFAEIKKSIPQHTQWLLLAIAFVIVLILLVMLLSGPRNKAAQNIAAAEPVDTELYIGPKEIEWLNVRLGDARTKKIVISASGDTKISSIMPSQEIDGLVINSDCQNLGRITEVLPCNITVEWTPVEALPTTVTEILISFHALGASEEMAKTARVRLALSTLQSPVISQPEPEPFTMPDFGEETWQEPELPRSPEVFEPDDFFTPEPCYEFAFPGFNTAGVQSGWIRPEGGRYLYHPLADVNCNQPTGEYNPNTGMITALGDPSRKIGTDSQRIGYGAIGSALTMPILSNPAIVKSVNRATQLDLPSDMLPPAAGGSARVFSAPPPSTRQLPSSFGSQATVSSEPQDRTFVLRQYKPIPATIVSEIRASKNASRLPVQATVDRNVYSDNGRTIVVPAGTLMIGMVADTDLPGPYRAIGRVNIEWYRFVRPDGVEFNFGGSRPFSADSQGRAGVPGRGSTDYLEQFVMPMITSLVPAAVNMIAPISDRFINQIDLDNNTVVQSGTVRSSELAKNEIITTWNKVAEKLTIDLLDNQVPPFSIAAGTRITVFSPDDLIVAWCDSAGNCAPTAPDNKYNPTVEGGQFTVGESPDNIASMVGQVRAYMQGLDTNINDARLREFMESVGQYQAKNTAAWNAYYNQPGGTPNAPPPQGTPEYNQQVLGLKYNEQGQIMNPFEKPPAPPPPQPEGLTCEDGTPPDMNGCCTGEVYTDMGEQGFNCCPSVGGDCFPPII